MTQSAPSHRPVALVTGATSGIGLQFAQQLAGRGYDLILASRNLEKMEQIKAGLKVDVTCLSIDLSAVGAAQRLYAEVVKLGVEIDVLINNAGYGMSGDHTTLDPETVERMLTLNILTLTRLCGLVARDMVERGRGHILNVASVGAYQPTPHLAAYGASKAYVLNFSEALTTELRGSGVVVTCLSPGATDTGFFDVAGIATEGGSILSRVQRMSAADVAAYGLASLFAGRLSVIPGWLNKLAAFAVRLAPRSVVVGMARLMTKTA